MRKYLSAVNSLFVVIAVFLLVFRCGSAGPDIPRMPVIDSEWWRIGNNPHYGDLMPPEGEKQPEVVDHGFVRARNGLWQLWACVRNVSVGRIFYRWEGDSIEQPDWTPRGVCMRIDRSYGESMGKVETIQAPYFMNINNIFHLFYGGGLSPNSSPDSPSPSYQICLATSDDGIEFIRYKNAEGRSYLFEGPGHDRDPMIIKIGDTYYCYYSCTLDNRTRGFIACRTSRDLLNWSRHLIVAEGGKAGNGPWSAECPYVVFLDGYYYLFRTQTYVPAVTHVYRSKNPLYFGVNDDSHHIGTIEAAAPEIIKVDDQYYISSTADYQGVMIAKLRWDSAGEK